MPRPLARKRIYDPPEAADGTRVLVDGLWPRGLSRRTAAVDEWLKDVAPSAQLRKWFGHDPKRWTEFRRRYRDELKGRGAALARLHELVAQGPVTLLYAARDSEHNNAVVLAEVVQQAAGE